MKVSVALSLNVFDTLSYEYKGKIEDIYIGARVIIPVGNIIRTGWIISLNSEYTGRTRNIIGIINNNWKPIEKTLDFVKKVSELYLISTGMLLDYCLPPGQRSIKEVYLDSNDKLKSLSKFSIKTLIDQSQNSPIPLFYKNKFEYIKPSLQLSSLKFHENYLYGKTRFDKYTIIISETLEQNRSVLIIVPDKLSIEYFKKKIPDIDIYNSTQKKSVKEKIFNKYSKGETGVIIGGLSALFLQINNLGCIISEKGNTIYSNKGILNGDKDYKILAKKKAESFNCPVYIGTPSIDLKYYKNNMSSVNKFENLNKINVVRIKKNKKDIFSDLIQTVKNYFSENKKILILLNRKQSKNTLYCEKCRKAIKCQNCNKFIHIKGKLTDKCPYCKHDMSSFCKDCGKPLDILKDFSIDTISKVLKNSLSETGILDISAEDAKNINLLEDNIDKNKIIISTPFIIGPYFKNTFDCVIYYKPESVFDMDSYKTAENIFSVLHEIKNFLKPGVDINVFSIYHFHYIFKLINDEEEFLNRELKYRKWFLLPPYKSIYEITVKEKSIRELGKIMRDIYNINHKNLNINTINLLSRKKMRGTFKGIMIAHTSSTELINSNIIKKKKISVKLVHHT